MSFPIIFPLPNLINPFLAPAQNRRSSWGFTIFGVDIESLFTTDGMTLRMTLWALYHPPITISYNLSWLSEKNPI